MRVFVCTDAGARVVVELQAGRAAAVERAARVQAECARWTRPLRSAASCGALVHVVAAQAVARVALDARARALRSRRSAGAGAAANAHCVCVAPLPRHAATCERSAHTAN